MNDDGHNNQEVRVLLLWTLVQMDLRLAEMERAIGLCQEWQFTVINELAEVMGLEPGYDRIEIEANQVMTRKHVPV